MYRFICQLRDIIATRRAGAFLEPSASSLPSSALLLGRFSYLWSLAIPLPYSLIPRGTRHSVGFRHSQEMVVALKAFLRSLYPSRLPYLKD